VGHGARAPLLPPKGVHRGSHYLRPKKKKMKRRKRKMKERREKREKFGIKSNFCLYQFYV